MPLLFESSSVRVLAGCTLFLAVEMGCAPLGTPTMTVAPSPSQAQVEALRTAQSRVLPLSREAVFPKVIGVLMDLGYQVRCANQELGQVNFCQTWYDNTRVDHPELTMEATLLFQAEDARSTRVRIVATGRWNVISIGRSVDATVTGSQPALDSQQCKRFLEQLEEKLCPAVASTP